MSEPRVDPPEEPAKLDIRIGHVEREAAVNRLQSAFSEGRLDVTEFDQRVAQVYAARTAGELTPLTADLPAVDSTQVRAAAPQVPPPPPKPAKPDRDNAGRALVWAWQVWATAVAVNLVVWLAVSISADDLKYFWPMWVAGPLGAVLLVATVFRNADRPPQS
jgi:hypothetical protein